MMFAHGNAPPSGADKPRCRRKGQNRSVRKPAGRGDASLEPKPSMLRSDQRLRANQILSVADLARHLCRHCKTDCLLEFPCSMRIGFASRLQSTNFSIGEISLVGGIARRWLLAEAASQARCRRSGQEKRVGLLKGTPATAGRIGEPGSTPRFKPNQALMGVNLRNSTLGASNT